MDILYYSNFCKHSKKTIDFFVKNNLTDQLNFICIDKRKTDPVSGQVYLFLENGTQIVLPPNIHSVPALLLVKNNYSVVLGSEIMDRYKSQIVSQNLIATQGEGEPMGVSLNGLSSGTVMSEPFTFYDATPQELSAKGTGRRPLYNYVPANGYSPSIKTPPDTYRPDKVAESVTVESLQQTRTNDINQTVGIKPPPFLP
jgi:hypothetical protein